MAELSAEARIALRDLIQVRSLTGEPWDIAAALNTPEDTGQTEPTGIRHDVIGILGALGPQRGNAFAAAVRTALPDVADIILGQGVDLAHPSTLAGLDLLQQAGVPVEDINTLKALGVRPVRRSPAQQTLGFAVDQEMVRQALEEA